MRKILLTTLAALAALAAVSCASSGAQTRNDEPEKRAAAAVKAGQWEEAARLLTGIEAAKGLGSGQYMWLATALLHTRDYGGALEACSRWEEAYPDPGKDEDAVRLDITRLAAYARGDYGRSMAASLRLASLTDGTQRTECLRHTALCMGLTGDDAGAADMYRAYVSARMEDRDLTMDGIIENGADDPELGKAFLWLARHESGEDIDTAVEYVVLSASCGNREALEIMTDMEAML